VIVYGRNAVREALRGRRAATVHGVTATAAASREAWLADVPVTIARAHEIEQICGSREHQGICARVADYVYADPRSLFAGPAPLIVALDEVQDPQNVGAICRTAECVGATGVVLPERRSAHVTAAVCKASAGAVEHLNVALVRNLADFIADAQDAGCWCYGAAAGAANAYDEPDYRDGVVLVLGAEGRGLRARVAAACDMLVALPLLGRVASLNVSSAGAVLMYEVLRARQRLDSAS
jgi:23S rRNA (guanosine2251-2'-O)-methyltransferase